MLDFGPYLGFVTGGLWNRAREARIRAGMAPLR